MKISRKMGLAAITLIPFGTGWLFAYLFPDIPQKSLMVTTPFYLWAGNMWLLGLVVWMILYAIFWAIYMLLILLALMGLNIVIDKLSAWTMRFWRSM